MLSLRKADIQNMNAEIAQTVNAVERFEELGKRDEVTLIGRRNNRHVHVPLCRFAFAGGPWRKDSITMEGCRNETDGWSRGLAR